MKKITLFFLTAFLVLSLNSYSQEESEVAVGLKAGWNSSNTYQSGNAAYDNLDAFYVGVFGEMEASEKLRFNSGLEYLQNGFTNSENNFKMHTLSSSSVAKYFVGPVYGMGGFALNFKLADNREEFPGGEQTVAKITNTNFFDIPLSLGLGVEISRIQIEAKYSWGLFNSVYVDGYANKNRYLQVGAAILF